MEISENIQLILADASAWRFFRNRSYRAQIEKANCEKIYNVPGKKGVVYNIFEDAYETVVSDGYVVTGVCGEQWPIGKKRSSNMTLRRRILLMFRHR